MTWHSRPSTVTGRVVRQTLMADAYGHGYADGV